MHGDKAITKTGEVEKIEDQEKKSSTPQPPRPRDPNPPTIPKISDYASQENFWKAMNLWDKKHSEWHQAGLATGGLAGTADELTIWEGLKGLWSLGTGIGKAVLGALNRGQLIGELAKLGIKHSADDIIDIARDASGRIIFLEKGNSKAGLAHILDKHAADFANVGVNESEIPSLVMAATTQGKQVGMQGGRPIFEVSFSGRTQRVAVTVADNGFVVGANPAR